MVSVRGATTESPASAPDAGRGSVGPSDAIGCGGTSDSPRDAFSLSWGPTGTEPSRGAPSSSSTIMWGTVCPPPGAWDPSGASDPPRALDPSGISMPPPTGGDHVVLLHHQLVEPMHVVSSTLYLRDRCLRRIGRRDSRLLSLTMVLGGNLSALRLPRGLRLLVLFSLFLLLVPGSILGLDLLVLWD